MVNTSPTREQGMVSWQPEDIGWAMTPKEEQGPLPSIVLVNTSPTREQGTVNTSPTREQGIVNDKQPTLLDNELAATGADWASSLNAAALLEVAEKLPPARWFEEDLDWLSVMDRL